MLDNTHQDNLQGYQSYEHCGIKQENESGYERRPLDQAQPGLRSGIVRCFKNMPLPQTDHSNCAGNTPVDLVFLGGSGDMPFWRWFLGFKGFFQKRKKGTKQGMNPAPC